MPDKDRESNPVALIGVGACLAGAGAALSSSLNRSGAGAVSVLMAAAGLVLMVLGFIKKRELESGQDHGDDDDRPPA